LSSQLPVGRKVVDKLPEGVTGYLIVSRSAKTVMRHEESLEEFYDDDIAAPVASGSFPTDAMIVAPCSMNTLAKIACGIADMLKLSRLGVIMAPPTIAYYSEHSSVEQMEEFIIGRWFDLLGIEHSLYRRWGTGE